MVRIVGILCGSAIAISFLIIALGVPEFLPESEALVEITTQPEPVAVTIDEAPFAVAPETQSIPEPEPVPEPGPETVLASSPIKDEPITEAVALAPPIPEAQPIPMPQASTEHWFAFWSPFKSELAANGFVSQLQRTTGLDYRVVRLKPGVYEVAFAYEDEADIETKLAAISAATGLEMPNG